MKTDEGNCENRRGHVTEKDLQIASTRNSRSENLRRPRNEGETLGVADGHRALRRIPIEAEKPKRLKGNQRRLLDVDDEPDFVEEIESDAKIGEALRRQIERIPLECRNALSGFITIVKM